MKAPVRLTAFELSESRGLKGAFRPAPPLPSRIFIEPHGACNLSCPLCPTGAGATDLKKSSLSFDGFKRIVDSFDRLESIVLFNWGEPFLNDGIFEMIRYAAARKIETRVDSNFSLRRGPEFFEELVASGLSLLRVSLDGASEETYRRYRVGGDFGLVLENIRALLRLKRDRRSAFPRVVWKFVLHKGNEHEVPAARRMARRLGVELLIAAINLADDLPDQRIGGTHAQKARRWLPRDPAKRSPYYRTDPPSYPLREGPCPYLFTQMGFHSDGSVFPCCYASRAAHGFGNAFSTPVKAIWTSKKYRAARGLFLGGPDDEKVELLCRRCPIYARAGASRFLP